MFSDRELYLMQTAFNVGSLGCYENCEEWLSDVMETDGLAIRDHIDNDADDPSCEARIIKRLLDGVVK